MLNVTTIKLNLKLKRTLLGKLELNTIFEEAI